MTQRISRLRFGGRVLKDAPHSEGVNVLQQSLQAYVGSDNLTFLLVSTAFSLFVFLWAQDYIANTIAPGVIALAVPLAFLVAGTQTHLSYENWYIPALSFFSVLIFWTLSHNGLEKDAERWSLQYEAILVAVCPILLMIAIIESVYLQSHWTVTVLVLIAGICMLFAADWLTKVEYERQKETMRRDAERSATLAKLQIVMQEKQQLFKANTSLNAKLIETKSQLDKWVAELNSERGSVRSAELRWQRRRDVLLTRVGREVFYDRTQNQQFEIMIQICRGLLRAGEVGPDSRNWNSRTWVKLTDLVRGDESIENWAAYWFAAREMKSRNRVVMALPNQSNDDLPDVVSLTVSGKQWFDKQREKTRSMTNTNTWNFNAPVYGGSFGPVHGPYVNSADPAIIAAIKEMLAAAEEAGLSDQSPQGPGSPELSTALEEIPKSLDQSKMETNLVDALQRLDKVGNAAKGPLQVGWKIYRMLHPEHG